MYDASDRQHVRSAEKAAKLAETQKRDTVHGLMSTSAGRLWMHNWLETLCVFQTPFTAVAATTDFNCGKQSVGLELLAQIMLYCPDQYVQMMREANERDTAAQRSREQSPGRDTQGPSDDDEPTPAPGRDIYTDRPNGGAQPGRASSS